MIVNRKLVNLYNILIIQVLLLMLKSLYSPFYPFFSLYTYMFNYNSKSSMLAIFGPFFIIKASLI
jgi:hypothetical protein